VIIISISELIRKIHPVDKDNSLKMALDYMLDNNLSCLPVTEEGEVIGIIDLKSILSKILSERIRLISLSNLYVSSVMNPIPEKLSLKSSINDAVSKLLKHNVYGLPVIDENRNYIGMISDEDLIKPLINENSKLNMLSISDINVEPNERILHIRMLILKNNLQVIPVVINEKPIGLIMDRNVLKILKTFYERTPAKYRRARIRSLTASHAMIQPPPVILKEASIGEAVEIILRNGLRGLILIDYLNRFSGSIQLRSLLNFIVKFKGEFDVNN